MIHVAGIDASLTRTGVAVWREGWRDPRVVSIRSKPENDNPTLVMRQNRLQVEAVGIIRAATVGIQPGDLALFVIEAPLYRTPMRRNEEGEQVPIAGGGHAHDRSGLWWLVLNGLSRHGLPAEVSTTSLKLFVTGTGSGSKELVRPAIGKQFPQINVRNHDEADALGLVWMGAKHLDIDPVLRNPRPNLVALDKVRWPLRERKAHG